MARALRNALKVKAIETTHAEALELIAKAFGYDNWNILSAKIEATEPAASDERSVSVAARNEPAPPKRLYCSFCG
jgi:Glyoxalase superfamily protein